MEEKSNGKSKEYIKELDLYEEVKKLTMQLHSAQAQLKSANAQRDQWIQEKERLTKENNGLKQKVKELTDQLGKNVGQKLTQIETLKRQIETYQGQSIEYEKAIKHIMRNFWKAIRMVNGMKAIMNEKRAKMKENQWINTNEVIEMMNKMKEVIRNETQ